jgi:hypothetical protein
MPKYCEHCGSRLGSRSPEEDAERAEYRQFIYTAIDKNESRMISNWRYPHHEEIFYVQCIEAAKEYVYVMCNDIPQTLTEQRSMYALQYAIDRNVDVAIAVAVPFSTTKFPEFFERFKDNIYHIQKSSENGTWVEFFVSDGRFRMKPDNDKPNAVACMNNKEISDKLVNYFNSFFKNPTESISES